MTGINLSYETTKLSLGVYFIELVLLNYGYLNIMINCRIQIILLSNDEQNSGS